jgi:sugar phosphate isomerase/epimerase
MRELTRREFLERATAAGAVSASCGVGLLADRLDADGSTPMGLPIGCQVYPLRSMLKDLPAFAKAIAGIGVTRLELCSPLGYGADFATLSDGRELRKILADHGLKAESSHFTLRELRTAQQKSIAWANDVGITQMVVATLADGNGGSTPTLDQVKRAAEEYNAIAAGAAKAGMQQGLHNEGFESSVVDGRRTYDLLLEWLDPKLVKFQFQMSTITAGFVATDYLAKHPGRFNSLHLQDVDMNAPLPPPEGGRPPRRPQVPVGKGSIDWVATFKAARTAGVGSYFVEQSWELTVPSVEYLKLLAV